MVGVESFKGLKGTASLPAPPLSPSRRASGAAIYADITTRAAADVSPGSFRNRKNSVNQKTMALLRNIMGQRNQDYVSDAATHEAASERRISSASMRPPSSARLGYHNAPHYQERVQWLSGEHRKRYITRVLNTRFWKASLIFFTFILLFGAQIRVLFLPKEADTAVDVINMMGFVFFCLDIILRMDAERNYFGCNLCGCVRYSSGSKTTPTDASGDPFDTTRDVLPFHLGSFLFFCDVVSTFTLLREISFIMPRNFTEEEVNIQLGTFGLPDSFTGNVNEAYPVEYQSLDMLAIIGKSARVARFIRSSAAVKLSSKVNWFLMSNVINPCWWWRRCRQCPARTRNKTRGRDGVNSLNSWSDVFVYAQATSNTIDVTNRQRGVLGLLNKTLAFLGIRYENKEELRRQVAATKIQRAWRGARRRMGEGYETGPDEVDVAWKGRGIATNAIESHVHKRSILLRTADTPGMPGITTPEGIPSESYPSETRKWRKESQVGTAMRELTGQRVAIGIILALIATVLFTYSENNATRQTTMIVLHSQTRNSLFSTKALDAARASSIPDLYYYKFANGSTEEFELIGEENRENLRSREKILISVRDVQGSNTTGYFAYRIERKEEAWVQLVSTIFVLLVWFFGVTSFAGPVMILVVVPIERMVRLLGMLMLDPLGYQNTSRYKRFRNEEDEITKNTRWTKEVLKGMETSFLMSTILRIGSLMKVGFGSAGVEIIRSNLQKGRTKNELMLSSQGSTVSCIFLFCDIRQFTDATECLQEEVFVFTNRIAAVVHSICHSYGGSANKNIGDAFLLSWILEEEEVISGSTVETLAAKHNQADKALLSVVKICMALYHDHYYVETMTDAARDALLAKLSKREGPIVQMGFGLHAGKAVQGAIGSTRKIDATYVSEAVERAEFLESSTKKYGLKMLMSDSFHRLLHPNNRRRCRKIDQILIRNENEEDDESEDGFPEGDIVELLTYDMDIGALWNESKEWAKTSRSGPGRESESEMGSDKESKREGLRLPGSDKESKREGLRLPGSDKESKREGLRLPGSDKESKREGMRLMPSSVRQVSMMKIAGRKRSMMLGKDSSGSEELSERNLTAPGCVSAQSEHTEVEDLASPELVLPTGPALYNASVWLSEEMRIMRQRYTDGLFFHTFNAGLQSFYAKDWDHAKQCFVTILDRFEDGPSRYFLTQIEKHKGKPPRNFSGYGLE